MKRTNDQLTHKFVKDQDQILALNYENLCDSDYLVKLFINEPVNPNKEDIVGENIRSSTEVPTANSEISEDVIVFGDNITLGRFFLKKRISKELFALSKNIDPMSLQIHRQVIVFEKMSKIVVEKCLSKVNYTKKDLDSLESVESNQKSLKNIALNSCLSILTKNLVNQSLIAQNVQSIVLSLIHFFDPKIDIFEMKHALSFQEISQLRSSFQYSACRIFHEQFLNDLFWNKSKFEEEISLSLSGIFGFLVIGLLQNNIIDIFESINLFIQLIVIIEDKVERHLHLIRDQSHTSQLPATISSNNSPLKNESSCVVVNNQVLSKSIPTKILNKTKKHNITSKPQVIQENNSKELSEKPNVIELNNNQLYHNDNENNDQVTLPDNQHKSAMPPSLDKKMIPSKAKDLSKGKANNSKQKSDKLYEIIDSKEILPNPSTIIVAGHVQINYHNYSQYPYPNSDIPSSGMVKIKSMSNNNDNLQNVKSINTSESTIQHNMKRLEKEIKNSFHHVFRVPKLIFYILNNYCKILHDQSSPKQSESNKNSVAKCISKGKNTKVWSTGQNSYGELGHGDINMRKSFTQITILDNKSIIGLGAGNEHSLFVSSDGKLLTAGYNDNGQCGVGNTQQVRQPTEVAMLDDEEVIQVHVYNGCEHTLVVTKEGKLYAFGYNYRGQLGLGTTTSESVPRPVRALLSRKVVLAACSYHHTMILCSDGTLFSCGRNDSGQLGHGDTVDKKTPQAILSAPRHVSGISCGQYHTVLVTSQGQVFVCGKNDYGQLGIDGTQNIKVLSKISTLPEIDHVNQVCCGYYHTLLLSSTGIVAGFGRNDYGQLGLGHAQPKVFQCTIINALRDKGVTMLSAGCYHSVAVTLNGMLYVFGRNNHGQLATGDLEERHSPHPVDDFVGQKILQVAAGFYHTLVLTSDQSNYQKQDLLDTLSLRYSSSTGSDNSYDANISGSLYVDYKHLSTNLKRDLELLSGEDNIDDFKYLSSIKFSILSAASCRDLLSVLIKNIATFDQRVLNSLQYDCQVGQYGLSEVLGSTTSLLAICFELLVSSIPNINLPLSSTDAFNLTKRILIISSKLLRSNQDLIVSEYNKLNEEELALEHQKEYSIDYNLIFISKSKLSSSLFDLISSMAIKRQDNISSENPEPIRIQLFQCLRNFRSTLLKLYFDSYSNNLLPLQSEQLIQLISDVILSSRDVLFLHPRIFLKLFQYVIFPTENAIPIGNLANMNHIETSSPVHLQLLACLGNVFQNIDDCLELFNKDAIVGMEIFYHFIQIYNYYCRISVEKRLFPSINYRSVDIRKIITVFDQCLSSMIKCAIPLIFDEKSNCQEKSDKVFKNVHTIGINAIETMIKDSESLLDLILEKPFSDETLGLLRFGTMIPSILPTTLLYAISYTKNGFVCPQLSQSLHQFAFKLQSICRSELMTLSNKLQNEKKSTDQSINSNGNMSSNPIPSNSKKEILNSNIPSNMTNDLLSLKDLEDEYNDVILEEISYLKKEQNLVSWWYRLLRICTTLLVKMDLNIPTLFPDELELKRDFPHSEFDGSPNDSEVSKSLVSHNIWSYLYLNIDELNKRISSEYLTLLFQEKDINWSVSNKTKDICFKYREIEKSHDPLYRMLSQVHSSQANISNSLFQHIEESLLEMVIGVRQYFVNEIVINEKLFHAVSNVIKFIHSKRSILVMNSNGLTWVEILLVLALIFNEFSRFIKSCVSYSKFLLPLRFPSITYLPKSYYRWKKILLVVKCLNRWKRAVVERISFVENDMIDYVFMMVSIITNGYTLVPSQEQQIHKIKSIYETLTSSDKMILRTSESIRSIQHLLNITWLVSIKSDIITSICNLLKDKMILTRNIENSIIHNSSPNSIPFICTQNTFIHLKDSLLSFEKDLIQYIESFSTDKFSFTYIEMQTLSNSIRLLEIFARFRFQETSKYNSPKLPLKIIVNLILKLFEKHKCWSVAGEEKPNNKKNSSTIRERNSLCKKVIFSLIAYFQSTIHFFLDFKYCCHPSDISDTIIQLNHILSYLQHHRIDENQTSSDDYFPSTNTEKDSVPLIPSPGDKQSKETNKKRCQDLITKPIDFSKNSEGVLVQGEKLMNNCKGVDFSIATWVLFTNRPSANKTSFILGKINHNEAWPMILLKPDGKLEILLGHNNEFERTSSENILPLYQWIHLTIVIEQKKIKLFINGALDCQITTPKGNIRAIIFPLLIGTCPAQMRTRVSSCKEGFDGMISQCKYYSRGLSPIHVKVIYDHGPPETTDVSAKVIYHTLSSLKCLLSVINISFFSDEISVTAQLCHLIFITETSRRNRYAGLSILKIIFSENVLFDLFLYKTNFVLPNLANPSPNLQLERINNFQNPDQTLMSCSFIPRNYTSRQALVLYFLSLVGCNWLQFVIGSEDFDPLETSDEKDQLFQFVQTLPICCLNKNIFDLIRGTTSRQETPPSNNFNSLSDRITFNEEPYGEISFHLIHFLHQLSIIPVWKEAISYVCTDICKSYLEKVNDTSTRRIPKLQQFRILGTSLLLGGVPSGAYLGADLKNYFDDEHGRIIQINNTINGATILSTPNCSCYKAIKVRLLDLSFDDQTFGVCENINSVIADLQDILWDILASLVPFVRLVCRDYLSSFYLESVFQNRILHKSFRPVECFIFTKLFSSIQFSPITRISLIDRPNIKNLLVALSEISLASTELRSVDFSIPENPSPISSISNFWFNSMKFFSMGTSSWSFTDFSSALEERYLTEYLHKFIGINTLLLGSSEFFSSGLWQLASLSSNEKNPESSFLFAINDQSLAKYQGFSMDHGLTERDYSFVIMCFSHLRKILIDYSRQFFRLIPGMIEYLRNDALKPTIENISSNEIALWTSIKHQNWRTPWISFFTSREFDETVLKGLSSQYLGIGGYQKFTTQLISGIKFSMTSLLQQAQYKQQQNILVSTDFFARFLRSLYTWIEYTFESDKFDFISKIVLEEFLPTLSFVENDEISLKILQLCVFVTRKLSYKCLLGWKPNRETLDLYRNGSFIQHRARAQEQVLKFKGHNLNDISHLAYNLTQLVSNLEIIQRRTSALDYLTITKTFSSNPNSKIITNLSLAKIQAIETISPKILSVKNNSVDLDLSTCTSSVKLAINNSDILLQLINTHYILDNIVVEVALGVFNSTIDCIFETIYCGSSHRFLQSGLLPNTTYRIKCRGYVGSIPLSWSNIVEFTTDKGNLFCFDPLRCGRDIIISENGLIATYSGDESWSTLLGSRSFSSGITSWEVKVNHSTTAYLFIGVAASSADLNTFLGGCSNGWGFIGEQALYHNREKVKVYGEPFNTGDVIQVTLNLNLGTLSFSKNRKNLGIAFDKIFGDLFPAVAFYNVGQELQILETGFSTTCAYEPIPISPSRLSLDDVSLLNELVLCIYARATLSQRLAAQIADHCNQWCTTAFVRCRAVSKKDIFLALDSPLLKRFGLVVGERVRTFYGVAEVAGAAYNRIWFRVNPEGEVWFCTIKQIIEGREKKMFIRCSYNNKSSDVSSSSNASSKGIENVYNNATYDASTIIDLLDPSKWSDELDNVLLSFLMKQSASMGIEPWKISSEQLFDNFRSLQQQLSRIVLNNGELTHRWGISGPKRKAVIARLGMLRLFNQMLDMYLPFLISDNGSHSFEVNTVPQFDDFVPLTETFKLSEDCIDNKKDSNYQDKRVPGENLLVWPSVSFSWDLVGKLLGKSLDIWHGPLHAIRRLIFTQTKLNHFFEVIKKTTTRPNKTEDDYDYPENLPHVKINRLKSFRAREAGDMFQIDGNDILFSTMFAQLYRELKPYNAERLRISYVHPMDDGQSRTFKIKFEGEGVDDYGGPYREIFQQIFNELQLIHPMQASITNTVNSELSAQSMPSTLAPSSNIPKSLSLLSPIRSTRGKLTGKSMPDQNLDSKILQCFLPILLPSPNWTSEIECSEKYRFIFHPNAVSSLKLELIKFMGQLVGIAIRSKITIDLAFPSFIWKSIVGEKLTEVDLGSFDISAFQFVQSLLKIHDHHNMKKLKEKNFGDNSMEISRSFANATLISDENETEFDNLEELYAETIHDLNWIAKRSDGEIIELIPGGAKQSVNIDDLQDYLTKYTVARFQEFQPAIQAFRNGLISIIPESSISILTWEELQTIICGSTTIDIDRLQDNTEYDDDILPDDHHILHFWEVLREFSEAEKSLFLKFVWARPTLPPPGVEFTQKMRILSIAASEETTVTSQDQFLPKAHTCFFSINLPKYSTKSIMADKLRYAILNCTEMDGDFRTTDVDIPGWTMPVSPTAVSSTSFNGPASPSHQVTSSNE